MPTGREKYTSARALGSNFDREHLLRLFEENAIAAKNKGQKVMEDKPPAILFIRSNLWLVVNLQDSVKAQQSRAYAQKVKISNLQQMANTIAYIQEHGYDTEADLQKACNQLSGKMTQARCAMEATTAELKAVNEKIHYTGQYLSSKAIYSKFLKTTNKKAFREEHTEEIARHEEALRYLKQHSPDRKFATMKELRAEKASLLTKRTEQYQTYTYFKDYHKELQTVCNNVDMILHQPVTQEAKRDKTSELS